MSDKLPIIYVYNRSVKELQKPHVGKFSIDVTPFESRRASVAYEPAVPRCKTCPRNGLAMCFMLGVLISDDDYCSNHPDAKP